MGRMSKPTPTAAELAILQVLWKRGPQTVRAVHEQLDADTGYTTVLKTMQIMADKGLVARDESSRSHVYSPLVKAAPTEAKLVGELMQRAFSGSAAKLAIRALSTGKPSKEELAEVRALLDSLEGEE
ncbi:MAG: BlaI/MecI/CopY family transcriptional regulator [Myxococcaceae bacterium]